MDCVFTAESVSWALNNAADEVRDIGPAGTSEQSRVDLVVAIAMERLTNPNMSLDDIIRKNWQTDRPDRVIGWVTGDYEGDLEDDEEDDTPDVPQEGSEGL